MARPALVCILALALVPTPTALAVPVDPQQRIELEQPSGDSFTARPFGDEWYNGRETASGFTILRNPRSGAWEYAEKAPAGELRRSGRVVGEDSPAGIARHLRDPEQAARAEDLRGQQESRPLAEPLAAPTVAGAAPLNSGAHPTLVILVQFTDQASLGTTVTDWHNRYFGPSDSLSDYYDEGSFGNVAIGPATETHGTANDGVVGWLTLPRTHPNTGANTGPANQQLVADAINAANQYVNFSSYDTDHSGWISRDELHITVIPAGWEASRGCGSPSVWGHKWGTNAAVVDGVFAGLDYTQFGEMHCDTPGTFGARPARMATLGIIAHEIGHDVDLPDLYDIDGSSNGGVGYWSVMAYGSWLSLPNADPGSSPPHLDAFSKSYEGWLTPTVAANNSRNALLDAAANPAALQVRDNPLGVDWLFGNHSGTGEYFLVENRQKTGYDRALPGCGLLIWHIDETRSSGAANATDSARLVDLEEGDADNNPFEAADTFVGARTFNATSTPNSNLNNGTASGVSLSNFSSTCNSSMSLDVGAPSTGNPPSGTNATVTTNEDTAYSFTATSFGFSDPDAGQTFDAVRIDTLPAAGSLKSNGVSVTAGTAYAPGTLTYTPTTNGCGAPYTSFTFSVRDSGGTYDPSPNTITVNVTCVNDAPSGTDGTVVGNEDGTYAFTGLNFGFSDPDAGNTLASVRIDSLPLVGSLRANGSAVTAGSSYSPSALTYTPAANACGTSYASFTFSVRDSAGTYDANPNTITVNVICLDDAPTGADNTVAVNEDGSFGFAAASFGFSDPDAGQTLGSVRIDSLPTAGSLKSNGVAVTTGSAYAPGSLTYTPTPNGCGSPYASFTFSVRDSSGSYDATPNTITVNVTCVDDAPTAADDSKTLNEDAPATTIDVLGNDANADGGTMTITEETDGTHGTVAITNDGVDLTYTPAANYCGGDSFTYTLNGGSTASVTVTVTCVDDAPSGADDTVAMNEDGSHAFTAASFGFSDPDAGHTLDAVRVDSVPTAGSLKSNGVAVTAGSAYAPGTLTYTPTANGCGATYGSFTFSVRDSAGTYDANPNTITVNVTCLDDAPSGTDNTVTITEDTAHNFTASSFGFSDPDPGDTFASVRIESLPTVGSLKADGVATAAGSSYSPSALSYTPPANACGAASAAFTFSVRASSGAYDTTPKTITVNVTCTDDAPIAENDSETVLEDSGATTFNVRTNDDDPDGGIKEIVAKTNGANGTVAIASDKLSLTYTPNQNFCGQTSFTYTLNGGDTATVTVEVTCVADPSVAVDDPDETVAEDAGATTLNVRANDTDPDPGQGPALIASKTDGGHGTVAITNSGNDVSYTPAADYCGEDEFTYTLQGGDTATVTVDVTCVADPSVAVDDPSESVTEDAGATTLNVRANDTDPDPGQGPGLIASNTNGQHGTVAITNSGNDLSYTPNANYCGTDDFTYTLNGGDTATVDVTVTCVDDAPVAVNDAKTIGQVVTTTTIDVLANDTDVDAGPKTITAKTNGSHGSVVIGDSGTDLAYTPDVGHCGADSFTYTLNGGSTATVNITILCPDNLPVAVNDAGTVAEDSGSTTLDVRRNDTDSDGGPKTINSKTNGAHGNVAITNGGNDLAYTPDANYCGTDNFTYALNGGSTATVNMTVSCVDDQPVAASDSTTTTEDASSTTIDVRANDTDIDGGTKQIEARTNGAHGAVAITNSGADLSYAPNADYCGTDSFTYTLNGGSAATVNVTVSCLDDAPVAVDDVTAVREDGWAIFDVRANDTDTDGGDKTIASKTNAAHGATAITTDGKIAYRANANYCGSDSFTYTLNGGSTATVTVAVGCAPEATVARDSQPPETKIADGPGRKVRTTRRRARVTFELDSSENGSTFLCKLDDGQFKPCGETKSYRLKPGRHTLWVVAVDAAGNADKTPVKKTVKVVRIAPRD